MKTISSLFLSAALCSGLLAACGGSSSSSNPTPVSVIPPPPPPPPPPVIKRPQTPVAAPNGPDFLPAEKGWELVWSDEFDGTSLDATKWSMEHACWGGGNNEKQCYTDRADNVEVVNGLLRIVALEERFTGPDFPGDTQQKTQPYTSGKVITRNLADWTYGRFSFRAKLPEGQGSWPAFWMLAATDTYGTTWPLSGEIDIMEAVNLGARCDTCSGTDGENRTSNAIHFGSEFPNNQYVDNRTELADKSNPADGYHVWAVEWGKGVMHWYLDGVKYSTIRNDQWYTDAAPNNPNAPFDAAFYLIINLAIGGNYPEPLNATGIADETLPNQLLVDWVRVHQCSTDKEDGLACMD
jgi:beta-glucanase (GH16 family)